MADITKRGTDCDDTEGPRGKRGRRGKSGKDGCDCKAGGAARLDPKGPHVELAGCGVVKSPYFIRVCTHHRDDCRREACQPNTCDDGINIEIQDVGRCVTGTIVMVAGTSDSDYLLYQINDLAGRGFRVIAITLRGNGESDQPYDSYTYDIWADDLRQILDCLCVSDVTLMGHSAGAGAALHYVARHQGWRVGRLALASTTPLDPTFAFPAPVFDGFVAGLLSDYPATLEGFTTGLFFPQVPSAATFQFLLRSLLKTNLYSFVQQAFLEQKIAPQNNVLLNDLPSVAVPTLILHGVQDVITPFGIALQLQAGIAGSTLVPFLISGHLPMFTEQQLFNDSLAAFAATGSCAGGHCPDTRCKKLVGWHVTDGPIYGDHD